ncbi:MAG: PH domain-containing protein [Acidobacteria bacterium]|nr:PH domain-containing protein [Acidobacteriota bacterium]MBI3470601.1 PH domain-containing protein [Candidatus Solibacter usitatus]
MADIVIHPSMKMIKARYVAVLLIWAAVGVLRSQFTETVPEWAPLAPIVLLLWPARYHLRRQTTKITITGDKLRYETGLLSKTTRNIQLSKVQDVRVDQSLGQRMLGAGAIAIETAGEASRLTVENIDNPQAVADLIIDAAHKGTKQGL